MTDKPRPELDFKSKEEFRDVCRHFSGRLHYLNRTARREERPAALCGVSYPVVGSDKS